MTMTIECPSCGADLDVWNAGERPIRYCPACGEELDYGTWDALWAKCCTGELSRMISEKVLDFIDNMDNESIEDVHELPYQIWESENCNGVLFCSDYLAERFDMRHRAWVAEALSEATDRFGSDDGHYERMYANCVDSFLVVAFIMATVYYFNTQIGFDHDKVTGSELKELRDTIKRTAYDGGF
jgi:Zn-finger nucleic acid-binding protein